MSNVWYEMGMRDGVFRGTVPAAFMNETYRFFLNLREACRKIVNPAYITPESEKNYTFNARDRFGHWRGFDYDTYRDKFTYQPVPLGSPIPEEVWNAEKPEWKKTAFSEKELLNEEIIPHELTYGGRGPYLNNTTQWEKQRYRLIQKMRYCIIPLQVAVRENYGNKDLWREYYGSTGCVDSAFFNWETYLQLRITVPDYWTKEGTCYKIGLFAENKDPYTKAPISGCRWEERRELTTSKAPADAPYLGRSVLRIYGAADLSTHPDYSKYFDL